MAQLVNILLRRSDSSFPWGFKAKVENGCGYALLVQRVTPGTISSNYLKPGDVILRLNNKHAQELANRDIDEVIKEAGNSLELIIHKRPHANATAVPYPGPMSPTTPATPQYNTPPNYPQPPPRNPNYMSPKPTSPTDYYARSPQNSSPTPYTPSSPTPSAPVNCPSPPPMPAGPGSPRSTQPPPPPPPPMPTGQTTAPWRTRQQQPSEQQQQSYHQPSNNYDGGERFKPPQNQRPINTGPVNQYDNLPAALQSTLSKDKKPFTYTPGGIDLSELKSPRMQRRIQLNQMDPPTNLAKVPPPPPPNSDVITAPPPPETYPQPRVQLLPTVHVHNRMQNAPQPVMNRPFQQPQHHPQQQQQQQQQQQRNQSNTQPQKGQQRPESPQRTQAYVHSPYNSPLNLYTPENVAEAFNSQTGEVLPGFENLQVNKPAKPSPNAYAEEDNFTPYYKEQHPQSRSFRLLQVMTDTTNPAEQEGEEKTVPVRNREEDEMKFTGIKRNPIPSRAFQTLQKITGDDSEDQSSSPPLVEYQPANEVNSSGPECELRYRGAYIPSRSFKILQSMTGGSEDEVMATNTRAPKKTSTMNIQVGNGPSTYGYNNSQDPYQGYPAYQGQWVPPSEQQAEAEPKKYMGGNIPSRSFRMLQAMTGGDDANDSYGGYDSVEIPVQQETTQQESEPRMYMGGNIPSRSFRMLQAMTDPNKE